MCVGWNLWSLTNTNYTVGYLTPFLEIFRHNRFLSALDLGYRATGFAASPGYSPHLTLARQLLSALSSLSGSGLERLCLVVDIPSATACSPDAMNNLICSHGDEATRASLHTIIHSSSFTKLEYVNISFRVIYHQSRGKETRPSMAHTHANSMIRSLLSVWHQRGILKVSFLESSQTYASPCTHRRRTI